VILAAGCFDGLSAPQVRYLVAAKRFGINCGDPHLCVTIERDQYIRIAKSREPYWPQADRAFAVSGLACVDEVYIQPEDESVPDVIRKLKPRLFVKGPEWIRELDQLHRDACGEVGAEIAFTSAFGRHWSDVRF
jgi:glycerol-3-phosphate cytidylyltransferase-like family protein